MYCTVQVQWPALYTTITIRLFYLFISPAQRRLVARTPQNKNDANPLNEFVASHIQLWRHLHVGLNSLPFVTLAHLQFCTRNNWSLMPLQSLSVDCMHLRASLETVNQKGTSPVIVTGPVSRVRKLPPTPPRGS